MNPDNKEFDELFTAVNTAIKTLKNNQYTEADIIRILFRYVIRVSHDMFKYAGTQHLLGQAISTYLNDLKFITAKPDHEEEVAAFKYQALCNEANRLFDDAIKELKALGFAGRTITELLFRQALYTSYELYGLDKTEKLLWSEHRRFLDEVTGTNMPAGHS